jgi:hypothetical protein
MIRRALRLYSAIQSYMSDESSKNIHHFALHSREWRQLRYLSALLAPYDAITHYLSRQHGPSVQTVLKVYNTLFDLLEKAHDKLSTKRVSWKVTLRHGIEAARDKLQVYYSRTYDAQGDLFAIATLLDPGEKLQFFQTKTWDDPEVQWDVRYRRLFTKVFEYYKDQNPSIQVDTIGQSVDPFAACLQRITKKPRLTFPEPEQNRFRELETYLNEGM